MDFLQNYINQLRRLCETHKVRSLSVFGSVLTGHFSKDSDIDLLVDFEDLDPVTYADNYFELKFDLQKLFNRPVDLLEKKALHNPFLQQQIDTTKVAVYGS